MLVPVTVIGTVVAAICRPPRRSGAALTGRLKILVARTVQVDSIPARGSVEREGANEEAASASAKSTAHVIDVLILYGLCGGLRGCGGLAKGRKGDGQIGWENKSQIWLLQLVAFTTYMASFLVI